MKNFKHKLGYALYILLVVVCPMCHKQMGIRYMQPIGKKGKGIWTRIKLANKDVVVIDDISKILQ